MRRFLSAPGFVLSGPTRSAIRIYDFMTLPSWGDAKVVKEPHQFPTSILERVHNNTTAPTVRGTPISLPTLDELLIAFYSLSMVLYRKVIGSSGKAEAEVMRRQLDLLDTLARSALAHDEEYDQIPDDDFASAS
ncbi:hypothetical protein Tco_0488371 [Tanacetum coccineum]